MLPRPVLSSCPEPSVTQFPVKAVQLPDKCIGRLSDCAMFSCIGSLAASGCINEERVAPRVPNVRTLSNDTAPAPAQAPAHSHSQAALSAPPPLPPPHVGTNYLGTRSEFSSVQRP